MEQVRPYYPVVIIGAGPAGLRAAFDLIDLGVSPLVIEKGERAGGRLLDLERWFALDACGLCRLLDSETRPVLPSQGGDILCLRREVAGRDFSLVTGSTVESARIEDGRLVLNLTGGGGPASEVSCLSAIVATGLEDTDLGYLSHLGAGREDDVVSAVRFEEMIARSSARPLTRPSDGRPVRSVGFVGCAGSRDDRHPWCSSSCCSFLAKEINLLREVDAGVETHLFCMDLRLYAKGMTLYGERALKGTRVHRAKAGSVERRAGGALGLRAAADDGPVEVDVDLVVLSGGQRPAGGRLLAILDVKTDAFGFPVPGSDALPWSTSNPHVFVAGSCRNPCDIATSVMEARAAAAAAFERLSTGKGDGPDPGRVLVLGGGIAGLEAARVLSSCGQAVTLVEKENHLGGLAASVRLDPGERKVADLLSGLERDLGSSDRVQRIMGRRACRLSGRPGSFHVLLDREWLGPYDSVVVATGSEAHLDGRLDGERILSLRDLEDRLARNDPVEGDVVFIQCVGSRDAEHPYCNRVCCAKAIRLASELQRRGGARAWILYRDIVTPGRDEDLYASARDAGVLFVRFDDGSPPDVGRGTDGAPIVAFQEKTVGKRVVLNPEILVLSSGIAAPGPMLEALQVPVGEDGFAAEDDARFRPCASTRPGIFVAGNARHPSNTVESQASGHCAAVGASLLARAMRKKAPAAAVSRTKERICTGCGLCVTLCPAGARALGGSAGIVALVQEPLCQACGSCAAACPSGAAVVAEP